MPSKGQAQAERDARDRKLRARSSVRIAVEEALDAGLTPDETARAFAEILRDRGLLGTADQVVTAARSTRKK